MKKRLKRMAAGIFAAGLLTAFFGILVLVYIIGTLPPPELIENRRVAQTTKIYDRTGSVLLYEIHGEERRTVIPLEKIPDAVKQATIASEDINFYRHPAFDWRAVVRALVVNVLEGRVAQGGSTITQQLAKNAFLTPERTLTRKIRELALALRLEERYTKDQILELYLNQIPYGSNAYGIEAASETFFGKSAENLSLGEATLLAALPKAPTYYSPWGENKDALISRQRYILEVMSEAGFVAEKEVEGAKSEKLAFTKPLRGIKAPHFVMMVVDYLNRQYGEDFVRTAGLSVTTALDWKLQELAEKAVSEGVERNSKLYKGGNAALVAQDPKNGQILALVGSGDYFDSEKEGNFNVAAQGLRQPGSAIKPFVYGRAFEKGYTPETVVFDLETEFDTTGDPEKSYKPGNYDGRFRGPITLRKALAQSINIPAVKTLYLVGLPDALETARRFGITTLTEKSRYGLSLVLGGGEVKLIDLVGAYSVFADDGTRHKQTIVLEVKEKNKILESWRDQSNRVVAPGVARAVNDILSDQQARAPIFGTSLLLQSLPEHQVAVKTGTTNDFRDAWTIGYTPSFVAGVWAGNNDNSPMTKEGASIAAAVPMWRAFMSEVLKQKQPVVFVKPDAVFVEKPVLRGDYITRYQSGSDIYPQIHEILFYVRKGDPRGAEPALPEADPQFENWETPALAWAALNVPDFSMFNKPLPVGSVVVNQSEQNEAAQTVGIQITEPENGSFIAQTFNLVAKISSPREILKIEFFLNNALVDARSGNFGTSHEYRFQGSLKNPQPQNLVNISVYDDKGDKTNKEIIVFSKTNPS